MSNLMTPLSAISQIIQEQLVELRYSDYPLLSILRKQGAYQNNIRWNANVSQDITGAGRATSADANAATSDTVVNANLPIGDAAFTRTVQILVTDIQQAKVAGVGALKALVDAHFRTKIIQILREMNLNLYTGTGNVASGGLVGLQEVSKGNSVYAGINPTTHAGWKGAFNVSNGNVNTALTEAMLDTAIEDIFLKGTGTFTHILTSPQVVTEYKDLFSNERALYTPVAGRADLGFETITYKGRPMIMDRDCPADTIVFLDSSYLSVHTRAYNSGEVPGLVSMDIAGMTFTMKELPQNNMYSYKFEVGVQPQLQAMDRRAVGVIADVG